MVVIANDNQLSNGVREPSATYQGIPCIRASANRTTGTSTDSYEVEMTAESFGEIRYRRPRNLYDFSEGGTSGRNPDESTTPRNPEPETSAVTKQGILKGTVEIYGDLVLQSANGTVTFEKLYVRDDGIEVVRLVDNEDGPTVVRLHLVDIRYWWTRRGELWGSYNLRRPDGTFDPFRTQLKLHAVITRILRELPGRPSISRMTPSVGKITPPDLRWTGIPAREELDRLLRTYRLTMSLTLDNNVEVTDATESEPPESKSGAKRTFAGASLPQGAWRRQRRRAFLHRPMAVRIVGPRVVREDYIDLEPVGFARVDGVVDTRRYVTWDDAAKSYGLTLDILGRLVLLSEKDRSDIFKLMGLGDTASAEVDRWAFRMFRFPKSARGFLPVLPERADSLLDNPGEHRPRIPPLVTADLFEETRQILKEKDVSVAANTQLEINALGNVRARLTKERLQLEQGGVLGVVDDVLTWAGLGNEDYERLTQEMMKIDRQLKDLQKQYMEEAAREARERRERDTSGPVTLEKLRRLSQEGRTRQIFVNRIDVPISSVDIDHELGIVRFNEPVGLLEDVNILAREQGKLQFPPRARIVFAYEDSASARAAVKARGGPVAAKLPEAKVGRHEVQYHYTYLAARTANGLLDHLNPALVDPPTAEKLFPLVIEDRSFRMFVTLDGMTNKVSLDNRAEEIARQHLFGPEDVAGEEGDALGFYPVMPSSIIQRVRWEMGAGFAKTTWSLHNVSAAKGRTAAEIGGLVNGLERLVRRESGISQS